ncbi:hypothetical protein JCM3766R1_002315 [Sporobolomyces carnicolor]
MGAPSQASGRLPTPPQEADTVSQPSSAPTTQPSTSAPQSDVEATSRSSIPNGSTTESEVTREESSERSTNQTLSDLIRERWQNEASGVRDQYRRQEEEARGR